MVASEIIGADLDINVLLLFMVITEKKKSLQSRQNATLWLQIGETRVSDQLSDGLMFGRLFQANERFLHFDLALVCRPSCILFIVHAKANERG